MDQHQLIQRVELEDELDLDGVVNNDVHLFSGLISNFFDSLAFLVIRWDKNFRSFQVTRKIWYFRQFLGGWLIFWNLPNILRFWPKNWGVSD